MTYQVPDQIRATAEATLKRHKHAPSVIGVRGVALAERLASGEVEMEDVKKMARFFRRQSTAYAEAREDQRRFEDNATLRSWELHGGDPAKHWSNTLYEQLIEEGFATEEPLEELFDMAPDEVYARFQLGAWRYEYGLNPRSAARFVVEYMQSTRLPFDITRAFGGQASSVTREVYRSTITDPYGVIGEAMQSEDVLLRVAADRDLMELAANEEPDSLDEAFNRAIFFQPHSLKISKVSWPTLVGYVLLYLEMRKNAGDLEEFKNFTGQYKLPPYDPFKTPLAPYTQYHDAQNVVNAYFHEKGKRFEQMTPEDEAKLKLLNLHPAEDIMPMMYAIHKGKPLTFSSARDVLLRAHKWCQHKNIAGVAFNMSMKHFKAKNLEELFKMTPKNADHYGLMNAFIEGGKILNDAPAQMAPEPKPEAPAQKTPPAAVEMTKSYEQAISDAAAELDRKLTPYGAGASGFETTIKQVTGQDVKQGDFLQTGDGEDSFQYAGAASDDDGDVIHLLVSTDGDVITLPDEDAIDYIQQGNLVLQGVESASVGTFKSPAAYFADTEHVDQDSIIPGKPEMSVHSDGWDEIDLADTATGSQYAEMMGQAMEKGVVLENSQGNPFKFITAYRKGATIQLIFQDKDADYGDLADNKLAMLIMMGKITIASSSNKQAIDQAIKDAANPEVQAAKAEPVWSGWEPGTLLRHKKMSERYALIVHRHNDADGVSNYTVQPLYEVSVTKPLVIVTPDNIAQDKWEFVSSSVGIETLISVFTPQLAWKTVDDPNSRFIKGNTFVREGTTYFYLGTYDEGDSFFYMAARLATHPYGQTFLKWQTFAPAQFEKAAPEPETTYQPDPETKPQPGHEDSQTTTLMCGTEEAIEYVTKQGWQHETEKVFKFGKFFPLGSILSYKNGDRTIIGYATKGGTIVYITRTAKGNVSWKAASNAHKQYFAMGAYDESLEFLPLPGTAAAPTQTFPKLDYGLSKWAKNIAKTENLTYYPSKSMEPKPKYYVGTKVMPVDANKLFKLEAFTENNKAVLSSPEDEDEVWIRSIEWLNATEKYNPHKTGIDGFTFTISATTNEGYKLTASDLALPTGDTPNLEAVEPIKQPVMETTDAGHVSAGVVVVMNNPTFQYQQGQSTQVLGSNNWALVMTRPANEYGGVKLTFPKGTIDPGESFEIAAIREVWEETGLVAKATHYLGDYKGSSSKTRMFMGYATGGDIKKSGEETDAVVIVPVSSNGFGYEIPKKYWEQLQPRDKQIVTDAIASIEKKGLPQTLPVDTADNFGTAGVKAAQAAQFSPGEDVHPTVEGSWIINSQDAVQNASNEPQLDYNPFAYAGKSDYSYVALKGQSGEPAWHTIPAAPLVNKGFPPPGALIKFDFNKAPIPEDKYKGAWRVAGYMAIYMGNTPVVTALLMSEDNAGEEKVTLGSYKGGTFKEILLPEVFLPVDGVEITQLPPPAFKSPIGWSALLKECPFPVTPAIHDMVKNLFGAFFPDKDQPSAVYYSDSMMVANKTMLANKSYDMQFSSINTDSGKSFNVYGFITLESGSSKPIQLIVGSNATNQNVLFVGGVTDWTEVPLSGMGGGAPMLVHPNPAVQDLMQAVATGAVPFASSALTVEEFRKYTKESGMDAKAASAITPKLIPMVVPFYQPQQSLKKFAAMVAHLKYLADAEQKVKETKKPQTMKVTPAPASDAPAPAPETTPEPVGVFVGDAPYNSAQYASIASDAQSGEFEPVSGAVGSGSNPAWMVGHEASGTKWRAKASKGVTGTKKEERVRAHAETAAYKIGALVTDKMVPSAVIESKGKTVVIQPFIDDVEAMPSVDALSMGQVTDILAQHALDMFMGDHDGHEGNWLKKDGKLIPIDRGQAFRFYAQDVMFGGKSLVKNLSLDPTYKPPGNAGTAVAKKMLVEWAKGNVKIENASFNAMRQMILKIEAMPDQKIKDILEPYFEAGELDNSKRKKVLDRIFAVKKSYLDDWTAVLQKIKPDFEWPTSDAITTETGFTAEPSELGLDTPEIQEALTDTKNLGWMGKSLRIDGGDIENQEVLVKHVTMQDGNEGTLINFRLSQEAGMRAEQALDKVAKVVEVGQLGPAKLKVDQTENLWGTILVALKSLNHHYQPTGQFDWTINPDALAAVEQLKPTLMQLEKDTQSAGTYAKTGEPHAPINAMANYYLQIVNIIIDTVGNVETIKEQNPNGYATDKFDPYVWTPPKEEKSDADNVRRQFKVTMSKTYVMPNLKTVSDVEQKNARLEIIGTSENVKALSGYNKITKNDRHYLIEVLGSGGAILCINAITGQSVRAMQGQAWGFVPGAPSDANVAILLKALNTLTKIRTDASKPEDRRVLFLAKTAAALQSGGKTTESRRHG